MRDRNILRAAVGPCVAIAIVAAGLVGALLTLDVVQIAATGALPYLIMLACPLVHLLVMRRPAGHCAARADGEEQAGDTAPLRTTS